ncbi:MAG: hypothetical protein AABW50_03185 [Nanoarchaeota archaeon]
MKEYYKAIGKESLYERVRNELSNPHFGEGLFDNPAISLVRCEKPYLEDPNIYYLHVGNATVVVTSPKTPLYNGEIGIIADNKEKVLIAKSILENSVIEYSNIGNKIKLELKVA